VIFLIPVGLVALGLHIYFAIQKRRFDKTR